MAKTTLTDMQRIILSNAAMRLDRKLLPVPKSLQKGAAAIALSIKPLLGRELVNEVPAGREDAVWREDPDSGRIALIITPAGMEAIGVSPDGERGTGSGEQQALETARIGIVAASVLATQPSSSGVKLPRDGSKLALLIETLSQASGATISNIMEVTGWQAHSVRGAISGALKKQFGMTVISELIEGRGRVYRVASGPSPQSKIAAVEATPDTDAPAATSEAVEPDHRNSGDDDAPVRDLQTIETIASGAV